MANNYGLKAYKASHNGVCKGFKFEVGKTYSLKEKPHICRNGFHYCKKASSTLSYYSYKKDFVLFEIKDCAKYTDVSGNKSATNKIKIVRKITDPDELFKLLGIYKEFNKKGNVIYQKSKNMEQRWNDKKDLILVKTKDLETCYYPWSDKYSRVDSVVKSEKTKDKEKFFNRQGLLTKHVDLKKRIITKYTYASDNVLLKKITSNGYKYIANKKDQVLLEIQPNGLKKEVSYNKDGLILKTEYSNGKFETFEYTEDNRLLNYYNTDGTTIKNTYKNNKLVKSEENIIKIYKNGNKVCNFTY